MSCGTCGEMANKPSERLVCERCLSFVHVQCLPNGLPTPLAGDVFFTLLCCQCSPTSCEVVKRDKMSWLTALAIAIYNLKLTRQDLSRDGFFHWKLHIATFLEQHWVCILGPQMKKRKTWLGTISGTLSHWSGEIFRSGSTVLKDSGWWTLVTDQPPADIIAASPAANKSTNNVVPPRRSLLLSNNLHLAPKPAPVARSSPPPSVIIERKRTRGVHSSIESAMALKEKRATLLEDKDIRRLMLKRPKMEYPQKVLSSSSVSQRNNVIMDSSLSSVSESVVTKERKDTKQKSKNSSSIRSSSSSKEEEEETFFQSALEEEAFLARLEGTAELYAGNMDALVLRRKLRMRKDHRDKGLQLFDFDSRPVQHLDLAQASAEEGRVLDRYHVSPMCDSRLSMQSSSLRVRLLGHDQNGVTAITSPHTGRVLKPYIRRDYTTEPLKLKILRELVQKCRPNDEPAERFPIDYMYVRPQHIPAINQLASDFFWPGINMSECLQYPDFSCVVVYRKIVVAFAFLVPDVTHTDAYISFIFTHPEWRRAGIAKFMLYHLIQTCMGKDITLHVSANNPAIFLYQKFGFKVEEHISNFYDKYLPHNSTDCKHALLLRLSR